MSNLPPLPQHGFLDDEIMVYTRQQVTDYGAAVRLAALEEAAKVCTGKANSLAAQADAQDDHDEAVHLKAAAFLLIERAAAIRALRDA